MTIDEVIENLKYDVEIDMYIRDIAPQLAEWLEDYKRIKMLIPIEQALKAEYNKAIDDFIKAADKHCGYYAGECKNLTRDDLLKIAEDLKNT
jgi:hypothetical protein